MSRDVYGDPGAATWGNPGAVTVGYIPEEEPKPYQEQWNAIYESKKPLFDAIREKRAEEPPKFGFKTTPEKDHGWRDLKIVQGQIIEGRDTGDESAT